MKKETFVINSNCDGLPLSTALFVPEGDIKAIVQISHGMAEHKERYYEFMEALAEAGYAAVINDHRGHGESVLDKKDLGYFYDDTGEFIIEDLHDISSYIKERFPEKPLYLFGHSMGSMAVRKYIKKYDRDIDKLVVCGSPSKNPAVGAALAIVAVEKAFKGDRHRSKTIQKLAFGSNNKGIENPVSGNAWLSVNEDNVKAYDADDGCGFMFTLDGFKNLFLMMKDIYQTGGWVLENKDLPILFIAGSEDPVIGGEKAWRESMEFLKKVGYTNVEGKLYRGKRHEILNEDNKRDVYNDVIGFFGQ